MNLRSLHRRHALTIGAASLLAPGFAWAQNAGNLRGIATVTQGTVLDSMVKPAQMAISNALGSQGFLVTPGGTVVSTAELMKSAPDGNTVAFITNLHSINPAVLKLTYDSLNDITPISVVAELPFVLVVNPTKMPVNDAKGLQALLRSKPDQFSLAASGNASINHLAGEVFLDAAGVKTPFVPHRGASQMVSALVAGQVDFGAVPVPEVREHIAAGRLRAIGVMGKNRVASLPNVPTLAEQGFPGVDVSTWVAVVGPKGLPAAQVDRLNKVFVAAYSDPAVKAAMAKWDAVSNPGTPDAAARFLKAEQDRYARLVARANIKVE